MFADKVLFILTKIISFKLFKIKKIKLFLDILLMLTIGSNHSRRKKIIYNMKDKKYKINLYNKVYAPDLKQKNL